VLEKVRARDGASIELFAIHQGVGGGCIMPVYGEIEEYRQKAGKPWESEYPGNREDHAL
jgi:hypothetical protein